MFGFVYLSGIAWKKKHKPQQENFPKLPNKSAKTGDLIFRCATASFIFLTPLLSNQHGIF
jgi:hypothetical protein